MGTVLIVAMSALTTAGVTAVLAEVTGGLNWLTLRLLRTAVRKLPERTRATRSKEWTAEIASLQNARFAKLILAVRLLRAANTMASDEFRPIPLDANPVDVDMFEVVEAYEAYKAYKAREARESYEAFDAEARATIELNASINAAAEVMPERSAHETLHDGEGAQFAPADGDTRHRQPRPRRR